MSTANVPLKRDSSKAGSRAMNKVRATGRNLKLEIEYDGSNYYGWQVQNSSKTIQHILEEALKKILQDNIKLTVAGRTDSGVHAISQVANFKSNTKITFEKLRWGLNCLLPEDIKITRIKNVPLDFNSRFWAKSKIYRYTILNRKYSSALLSKQVYFFHYPLNIALMRKEARVILGRHNFKSFQAADTRQRNPIRTIKRIKIFKDNGLLHVDIEADSFLYNMVRNIVGTLLEIGRGRFSKGAMLQILKSKDRSLAGPTLPAKGLCLLKVKY